MASGKVLINLSQNDLSLTKLEKRIVERYVLITTCHIPLDKREKFFTLHRYWNLRISINMF